MVGVIDGVTVLVNDMVGVIDGVIDVVAVFVGVGVGGKPDVNVGVGVIVGVLVTHGVDGIVADGVGHSKLYWTPADNWFLVIFVYIGVELIVPI